MATDRPSTQTIGCMSIDKPSTQSFEEGGESCQTFKPKNAEVVVKFNAALVHQPASAEQTHAVNEAALKESSLSKLLGLYELRYPYLWRAVLIEVFATFGMFMVSIGAVLSSFGRQPGPGMPPLINPPAIGIAISHFFIMGLFIFSFAAPSGGHMNPLISFSTMCTGHMPVARGMLYILAQTLGSILASALMQAALPHATQKWSENMLGQGTLGGCAAGEGIEGGQLFLIEFAFSLGLLIVAYGVAFDARQGELFGPILAPLAIAATLGTLIFASGTLAPQSSGACMNPARCFGPAFVTGEKNWEHQWARWLGPFCAALVNATVYWLAPPHHKALYDEQQAVLLSKAKQSV